MILLRKIIIDGSIIIDIKLSHFRGHNVWGSLLPFFYGNVFPLVYNVQCKIFNLVVKGVNTPQSYEAPVVKFPVDVPGQGKLTIKAVCLPTDP